MPQRIDNLWGRVLAGLSVVTGQPIALAVDEQGRLFINTVADGMGLSVQSHGATIAVTPVISAGAYVANDCVGPMIAFVNAARFGGGGGVIKSLFMIDDVRLQDNSEVWLFDQAFTSPGDKNPWVLTEADAENCIGVVNLADGVWYDGGGAGSDVCDVELAKRYDVTGTSLFAQIVTRGVPAYTAIDDLTLKLGLLQD